MAKVVVSDYVYKTAYMCFNLLPFALNVIRHLSVPGEAITSNQETKV